MLYCLRWGYEFFLKWLNCQNLYSAFRLVKLYLAIKHPAANSTKAKSESSSRNAKMICKQNEFILVSDSICI